MVPIKGLGHIAVHANDPKALTAFYHDVLGLHVVDTDKDYNMTFLSSRPGLVNHDLSFTKNPNFVHFAYEVDSLTTLRNAYVDLKRRGIRIMSVMNFGWSMGVTFADPEGNRCELFWTTGRHVPHRAPIDLERSEEEILAALDTPPAPLGWLASNSMQCVHGPCCRLIMQDKRDERDTRTT